MALQDICKHDSKVQGQTKTGYLSLSGNSSGTGLNINFPLGQFKFSIPVTDYLEESPLQFGQIPQTPASDLFSTQPSHVSLPSLSSHVTPLPFPLSHGTTTLAFIFQGGVLVAADTRSSCSGRVACPAAQKILPIHSHLVGTTSGTSADCALWKRILSRELRLYQLRFGRRLSTRGAAKLLSHLLHPFKGTEVCVAATLCGWDGGEVSGRSPGGVLDAAEQKAESQCPPSTSSRSGPSLFYVCSDGTRLQGALFSVGSGSPYAYSVLDQGVEWGMTLTEAVALGREAVYRATHRDAYSGNCVDVYLVSSDGWRRRPREDLREEYHRERERERERNTEKERCA